MDKKNLAKRILPLIDLTSLNETDNDETIKNLCSSATTPFGKVALNLSY